MVTYQLGRSQPKKIAFYNICSIERGIYMHEWWRLNLKKRHVHISVFSVLLFLGGAFTKGLNGVMVFTADGQFLFVRVKSKIFTINFSLRLTVINLSIIKPTNLTMGLPLHRGKYGKPTKSRTSNCFVMLPCVPGETLRNSHSSVSRKAP